MKLHIVFVIPEAVPFLQATGFIKVEELENHHYFICKKIEEKSNYFLDLHFKTSFEYEVSLPYHYVQYVVSAEEPDLNKILGFHTSQLTADNQPGKKPPVQ
jgi:hypothetical protein